MKIDNSLGKTFEGPPRYAAFLFLFTGVAVILMQNFDPLALALGLSLIVGAIFVITTTEGVEIETAKQMVKQYTKFFGFLKAGKWKNLDAYIGVTLIQMTNKYTVASRANLTTSSTETDYRIYLVNQAKKPAFAIKKCKTEIEGQNSLDEFSLWLKRPVFSPKISRTKK